MNSLSWCSVLGKHLKERGHSESDHIQIYSKMRELPGSHPALSLLASYYCVINTSDKSNLRRGGSVSSDIPHHSLTSREVRGDTQARAEAQTMEGCYGTGLFPPGFLSCFLIQPRSTCPGWHCPKWAGSSHNDH